MKSKSSVFRSKIGCPSYQWFPLLQCTANHWMSACF